MATTEEQLDLKADEVSEEDTEEEEEKDEREGDEERYGIGVLAGLEWSPVQNAKLTDEEKNELKQIVRKAAKRDYPARLIEVIQAWEAALFYRGFQFLIPQRGGGWLIPGESTGYGPTMQMDLALLPTNIYSARAQMIIAALTRSVPNVRFGPAQANSDAAITAAESADKFTQVISKNNDLILIQTDGSRYLWTDGRYCYWSRYVKDGERFGWEEDDEPSYVIPELEAAEEEKPGHTDVEAEAASASEATPAGEGESPEVGAFGAAPGAEAEPEGRETEKAEPVSPSEKPEGLRGRKPHGQEVRTCHGKLEVKLVPMMANELCDVDVLQLEYEVDIARAKGMFPWVCDEIKSGGTGVAEADLARLARQNVKLGMQSTYITSSSVAEDTTVLRSWIRPAYLMHASKGLRDGLIEKFPNGCLVVYAGETFCYARNESLDDSWSMAQAYSGDGQNRNAMGTSTLPVQKRLNTWLDLMNDFFVRAVPRKWMDNKAFNVQAIKQQTNVPGDVGPFQRQPGVPVAELIFVEPQVLPPTTLSDFIQQYSGPLAELLSGAYPALAGGDVGTADSGVAIATQRDSALGRLAPTWHSMKKCEAQSMRQLVRWGAKCRDKSINEQIPGGEAIRIEINDLKGNILVYAESDENFPETYTQKKNSITLLFQDASKNPELSAIFDHSANLEFCQSMFGLRDLYIPKVASRNKQLGEIELLLRQKPAPNPKLVAAQSQLLKMQKVIAKTPGADPSMLQQVQQQIQQLMATQPQVSSIPIDPLTEDNAVEAETCWQYLNSAAGRRDKRTSRTGYENVRLHFLEHETANQEKIANQVQGKPPSVSIGYKDVAMVDEGASKQILTKAGIQPTPAPGAGAPPAGPTPGTPQKEPAKPIPGAPPTPTGARVS